jgi:two-component system, NarL family, response regulator LiaR
MNSRIKIIIVDDDPLVGESLKFLLSKNEDMTVIGIYENGLSVVKGVEELKSCGDELPDVVLMDIQMPEMDGIEATALIKKEFPEIRVMMLTTFKDEHSIRRALLAGAEGYLIKSTEVSSMAVKLRALFTGTIVMDQRALEELTKPKVEAFDGLSPREQSIARLVGEGLSNKEISKHLFISEGTVRNNLSVILEKLNLRDRTQLAILYLKK